MSDRIPLDHLTSDALDALYDQLAGLNHMYLRAMADLGIAVNRLDHIRALHQPKPDGTGFPDGQQCTTCSQDGGDGYQYLVPWPCPTVRALDGPAPVATDATGHVYLSTGCRHGQHGYCQSHTGQSGQKTPASCKFCGAPCICGCHQDAATGPLVDRPFRTHRQPTDD